MLVHETQALVHPGIEPGGTMLLDLAHDVLAVAQPAQVRAALTDPQHLAAVFAGQAGARRGRQTGEVERAAGTGAGARS